MSKTLSVFFNIDRTYLTVIEHTANGLSLEYVNSTKSRINFENLGASIKGVDELHELFNQLPDGIARATVTMPAEGVMVAQFPGRSDLSKKDLEKLVSLEIRQIYPQFNFEDFKITLTPFLASNTKKQTMLAVIIPLEDYETINRIMEPLNLPITNIEISQLNAHSCFLYNYPEMRDKTVALLSVQNQFMDFSIVKNGTPAYYSLSNISRIDAIGEVFENEYNRIVPSLFDSIDAVYYFGSGLTKDVSMMLWETSMLLGIMESKRLNAFRMMLSNLDKRDKEYCSRAFQLYPACVGGCMPARHDFIKF